ncbi:MAG: hypothetical protein QNJ68_23580 [Microcoleaceae cyanobacterium MO_207.B10]|nr:hypothetical protein [Microcoleaceae cyanobacterium MO_207.B10]
MPIESVNLIEPEKEKLAFTITGDISYTDVAKLKAAVTGVNDKELLSPKIRTNQSGKNLNFSRVNLSGYDLNKTKTSILNLTNKTITLDKTVYQVINITSVRKYRIKPNYFFKLSFIFVGLILSLFGIEWMKSNPDVKWFTFSVIFLTAWGIIELWYYHRNKRWKRKIAHI